MGGLFGRPGRQAPLADRLRPRTLDDFIGQEDVVGPLRALLRSGAKLPSMILWGPPGSGKTTLARIVGRACGAAFVPFSAVTSGLAEVRRTIQAARARRDPTLLFVDEIHRFNRAQQDAFLPHIEDGTITLIGATTENPSFEVNAPLLSRCRVYRLRPLASDELRRILARAIRETQVHPDPGAIEEIVALAGGDARVALNLLEACAGYSRKVTAEDVRRIAQSRPVAYDKNREEHYNVVSAYIKSMRGSDPDAALYWLARMLEGGEDPLFVARRLVIFASEDVGNADPRALPVAVAAMQAVHFVGMPEAMINLAHATTFLACCPKSNAAYKAYLSAREDVRTRPNEPVPLHLRNAPTPLMKAEGYARGYKYPHDFESGIVNQAYRPPSVQDRRYYFPTDRGEEKRFRRNSSDRTG